MLEKNNQRLNLSLILSIVITINQKPERIFLSLLPMAFHYRKLLDESDIDKSCSSFCDPDENPDAICSFDCINLCHTVCHAPPPPLPFPTPSTVVDDTAAPHKTHKLSLVLTVSLAVLATAFFLFTCYTVYKFYSIWYKSRRRRVEQTGQDQDPGSDEFLDEDQQRAMVDHHVWYIRTVGLHPSVISAITVVKYKKGDGMIEGSDCSVCLSEFRDDEMLRLLPKCNHAFHIPCIDTWLRSHTNCPLCRAGIVKNTPEEVTVNDSGVEEAGIESSESNRASRIGIEDDNETQSVSVDPLSATAIHSAMADDFPGRNSDDQLVGGKE